MPKTTDTCTQPPPCMHEELMTTLPYIEECVTLIEVYSDCNNHVSTQFLLLLPDSKSTKNLNFIETYTKLKYYKDIAPSSSLKTNKSNRWQMFFKTGVLKISQYP